MPFVRARDARGWFARTFDEAAFEQLGLETRWALHADAWNERAGTVRGLHFQRRPHAETKLIACTRGAVYDVLLDVRPDSPTFAQWEAFALHEDDATALYAPGGLAHGYQSLTDGATMHYLLSEPHAEEAAAGYRFDSPALGIAWPLPVAIIAERDRALPPFDASRVDA